MSMPNNTNGAEDALPPPNTFPAYGATPIDRPASAPPSSTAAHMGTQTNRTHTPAVTFASRIEVRGPDGTTTTVPINLPASSSGVSSVSSGPPSNPPVDPPAAVSAPTPGGSGPNQPPPPPPPSAPPGGPPGWGMFGQNPANTMPIMNMNQPTFIVPSQQPYLWVNPPVVSSMPATYPAYRSSQQSPYWNSTSHWSTNPPQQPQPQQYAYVAGYPTVYHYTPGYVANPTFYYL